MKADQTTLHTLLKEALAMIEVVTTTDFDLEKVADLNRRGYEALQDATGTTSDQYRAELYDEVWEQARDMGFGNVSEALAAFKKLSEQTPVTYQYLGSDNEWKSFSNQQHYQNTLEDGKTPIRALYADPLPV